MPSTSAILSVLSLVLAATAGPTVERRAAFTLQNGKDAQALNAKFATLSAATPCTAGENACINGAFAQCVGGTFLSTPCAGGLTCVALPLVNSAGTRLVTQIAWRCYQSVRLIALNLASLATLRQTPRHVSPLPVPLAELSVDHSS